MNFGKHNEKRSVVIADTLEPVWDARFDWMGVNTFPFAAPSVLSIAMLSLWHDSGWE
jgi:hypothetical protein